MHRYWTGEKWSGDTTSTEPESGPLLILGYLLALFFAPVGLVVGIVIAFRGRSTGHGVAMAVIGGLVILAAMRAVG